MWTRDRVLQAALRVPDQKALVDPLQQPLCLRLLELFLVGAVGDRTDSPGVPTLRAATAGSRGVHTGCAIASPPAGVCAGLGIGDVVEARVHEGEHIAHATAVRWRGLLIAPLDGLREAGVEKTCQVNSSVL